MIDIEITEMVDVESRKRSFLANDAKTGEKLDLESIKSWYSQRFKKIISLAKFKDGSKQRANVTHYRVQTELH